MALSTVIQSQNLIPEWSNPKGIAIVYPERLPENPREKITKKSLIPFYDAFIQKIIENADISELTIIHRSGMKESLSEKFKNSKVSLNLIEIGFVQDIWIRDWAPIAFSKYAAFKTKYHPQYFESDEGWYAKQDDNAGIEISTKILDKPIVKLTHDNKEIILDGGNFIHNGKSVGITTNRILEDNKPLLDTEIEQIFKEQLGLTKLLIVKQEPGDITGHIDGMVRFIDDTTVVVASYPLEYKEGRAFLDTLASSLQKDFNVVRICNTAPKDITPGQMPSAFGNYINYLRIGNKIFLPQYGIKDSDNIAKEAYEKYFEVIPIEFDIDKLSDLGGVLNCITWTYY